MLKFYPIYMIMVWEWITLNMLKHDFLNYFVFYDMDSNGDILLSSYQFDVENNLLLAYY